MEKRKLGIFIATDINFLGGLGVYQQNLINFLNKKTNVTYFHIGFKNEDKFFNKIRYTKIKISKIPFIENIIFDIKTYLFLRKNNFDLINSHGFTGLWAIFFNKKYTKIVHTYHGCTYYFYKCHLNRFGLIKKVLFSPILLFPYFIEKYPWKKADKIICVSEHVKKELEHLYGKRGNVYVIRTGVDLKQFKPRNKEKIRKELHLEQDKIYGLYVGRGGFWTKGLDKVIRLSKEIYNMDKNYRLIIIGADKEKVKNLINEEFILFLPPQSREKIPFYYNASDIFFSMSRYEGGAPTLVTGEAMASGCLIVTDKEANQEVIFDGKNGVIINKDYKNEAKKLIEILKNKKNKKSIVKKSINKAKEFSLEIWQKKYLEILFTH